MESNAEVGRVNISEDTYEQIRNEDGFDFENRGKIEVKGKGAVATFFLAGKLNGHSPV